MSFARLLMAFRFLILQATLEHSPDLRLSSAGLAIFGIALATAGFALTGLLCFAVRNILFQADAVFLPAFTSCAIGLLTIFYNFLVFNRYAWGTPAVLLTAFGSLGTVGYGVLLVWTLRKIATVKTSQPVGMVPLPPSGGFFEGDGGSEVWQERTYYDNYVRNMFPTSLRASQRESNRANNPQAGAPGPDSITEEEMQRQQMLMLLLHRQESGGPDQSQSTFRIDWQSRDDDEPMPPSRGYYAPPQASVRTSYAQTPLSAYPSGPMPPLVRRITSDMQPWDGVWRTAAPVSASPEGTLDQQSLGPQLREARRREIEQGR